MSVKWWGYRHVNGSVQAKRYFDREDMIDAVNSPFCSHVAGPFEVPEGTRDPRQYALDKVSELTDSF